MEGRQPSLRPRLLPNTTQRPSTDRRFCPQRRHQLRTRNAVPRCVNADAARCQGNVEKATKPDDVVPETVDLLLRSPSHLHFLRCAILPHGDREFFSASLLHGDTLFCFSFRIHLTSAETLENNESWRKSCDSSNALCCLKLNLHRFSICFCVQSDVNISRHRVDVRTSTHQWVILCSQENFSQIVKNIYLKFFYF